MTEPCKHEWYDLSPDPGPQRCALCGKLNAVALGQGYD